AVHQSPALETSVRPSTCSMPFRLRYSTSRSGVVNSIRISHGFPGSYGCTAFRSLSAHFATASISSRARAGVSLRALKRPSPLFLHDELASRVEVFGNQRVERPLIAGAVAVHDDDLAGARHLRAAHGGVDLLGVELSALLIRRTLAARRLLPLDDPGDAFHVA